VLASTAGPSQEDAIERATELPEGAFYRLVLFETDEAQDQLDSLLEIPLVATAGGVVPILKGMRELAASAIRSWAAAIEIPESACSGLAAQAESEGGLHRRLLICDDESDGWGSEMEIPLTIGAGDREEFCAEVRQVAGRWARRYLEAIEKNRIG
jgi:hypothetical protein